MALLLKTLQIYVRENGEIELARLEASPLLASIMVLEGAVHMTGKEKVSSTVFNYKPCELS